MNRDNDTPQDQPQETPQPESSTWHDAPDTIVDREPATVSDAPITAPAPAEPVAAPAPAPVVVSSRRSKKPLIAAIAIGAAVVLLGGTAAAYQLWYQNPDKVVTDSIVKALTAKTATYTGTFDTSGETNMKVTLNGSLTDTAFASAAKITLTNGATSVVVDGDVQAHSNGDFYVKIKNAKDLAKSFFQMSGLTSNEAIDAFVAKIDNKWLKLTAKDLDTQTDTTATSCTSDTLAKLRTDTALQKEVTDAYNKQRFIVVKERLGEKDGSLGYKLDVDEAKSKAFAEELKKTKLYADLKKCDDKFTLDDTDTSADNSVTTVELWANKWSHELTKLSVTSTEKKDKLAMVLQPTFNKPVTISAPTDVMTFDQLKEEFNAMLMSLMGGMDMTGMAGMNGMTDAELSTMEMQLMGANVEQ